MAFSQFFVKQFLLVPLDHHWKSFWQQKSSERARPPTASQWVKTFFFKSFLIFICTYHSYYNIKNIEVSFRNYNGTRKTHNIRYFKDGFNSQCTAYREAEFTFKDKFSLLASQKKVMFSYSLLSFSTSISASIEPEYEFLKVEIHSSYQLPKVPNLFRFQNVSKDYNISSSTITLLVSRSEYRRDTSFETKSIVKSGAVEITFKSHEPFQSYLLTGQA